MKFTDGYWLLRPGVTALHPLQVRTTVAEGDDLVVHAPTRPVAERKDTLNQPSLTIRCTAPAPDVIGVEIAHFLGGRPRRPEFALASEPGTPVSIEIDDEQAAITSGSLTARLRRGATWRLDFLAGDHVLTSSLAKAAAALTMSDGTAYVREQLTLGVGECVYGLGERFGPLVKNGQSVEMWHADGGTSSEQAYKNVPFYLTNRGYGVFVDHPGAVSFEIGSEAVARAQFSVAGQRLRYFVIHGPTPADILRKYTALTGRPALPPAWSFGLWLSTSFSTPYDEPTVTGFIDEMARRELPLSVFHFDCFWMREFQWCDFVWDPDTFPDPAGMLARLHERGLHTCVWINPYVAQRSSLFAEGAEQGFLVRTRDGDVWQTDLWQAGMGIVDFTNPAARQWFADKLRPLLAMGVDAFKTDFGERIPTDVAWHDGSDPERMHNHYTHLYNETVFGLLCEVRGEGEAVVFARSATAGGQRFPVHWGGDCETSFTSMAETLRGGLSLAASGFAFWSHDIGGFDGDPDPAVFKRWIPFGLLSTHSRLHGNHSYRVPWAFDEESVDVLRTFTRLKLRLMPYLFQQAVVAARTGVPVLRPMALEFPDDPACTHLDRQYLLGESLLVAPVFDADGTVDYYLPVGTWTHLQTGVTREGPGWVRETCDCLTVPVYVRPGTVLPWGAREDRPDYAYAEGVTLRAYGLGEAARAEVTIPALDGTPAAVIAVTRRSGRLESTLVEGQARWTLVDDVAK